MSRQTEAHLVVEPVPRNVSVARQFLRRALKECGSAHLEEIAVLLVSELLTNVILHAGTPGELSVVRSGSRVRVEVRDGGAPLPAPRRYALEGTTGRGLMLVDALAVEWGVEEGVPGKVVWFELDDAESRQPDHPGTAGVARSRKRDGSPPGKPAPHWRDLRRGGDAGSHLWRWRPGTGVLPARASRAGRAG